MKGHIQQRGARTWRLKFDIGRDAGSGRRVTRFVTFHGTKREAQSELARLIAAVNSGNFVETSKLTVATYLRSWIEIAEVVSVSPKTAERYRELIGHQITPHIGALHLQKLRAPTSLHGTALCCVKVGTMALALRLERSGTHIACCIKRSRMLSRANCY